MLKYLFAMLACLAMLSVSCDDDNGGNGDNNNSGSVTLTGAMQKGPLIQGSSLTVSMLDSAGAPTGDNYATTTEDELGAFNVVAATSGPCELIGEGFYYNEITDSLSGAPITLRALYEIIGGDPQEAYLNVFTHMSSGLALKDFREGTYTVVAEAVAASEDALFEELGIQHPLGGLVGHGTEMDLTGVDSPDNQYIMAVSCIIGKAAELRAADVNEVDARLQELVNDIRSQLQTSGVISAEYKQYLRNGEAALDPIADCVQNLADYLESKTGEETDLPDANQAADMDGDGTPNALDDDIDGDGVPNDANGDDVANTADCTVPTAPCEDEAPYDASVGAGMYIDSVNGLGWQLTPPDGTYTWAAVQTYCADTLLLGGHDDWRMPALSELYQLVTGCDDPPCESGEGPGAGGCYWSPAMGGSCEYFYWSSDSCTDGYLSLEFSSVSEQCWDIEYESYYIRCVRDL